MHHEAPGPKSNPHECFDRFNNCRPRLVDAAPRAGDSHIETFAWLRPTLLSAPFRAPTRLSVTPSNYSHHPTCRVAGLAA